MTDYPAIIENDWQPLLGSIGEVITGPDEINQAIRIILETPKGADPLRPDFGSGLLDLIDGPMPEITPRIIAESIDAVRRWEPRVKVLRVDVSQTEAASGRVSIGVTWEPKDGGDSYLVEVNP